MDKSGKQNTQTELLEEKMTVKEHFTKLKASIYECIPHITSIKWICVTMGVDIHTLPSDTLLVFTNFDATMQL